MEFIKHPPHVRYRVLMNRLDELGVHTHIERVDKKFYNLITNGEIIKCAKQRRTLNRALIKIYNQEADMSTKCTSCEAKIKDELIHEDDDCNPFCSDCWDVLAPVMREDFIEMKLNEE